ncbi:hypothetical protein [Pseudomonas sp. 14A]|uniref:hypothetical protein n=1 Tax=Pseudomonas sp. 14A TaxID=2823142 RepID=UPI001B8439F2|nr:hypothetical protein [Pseudomonas sp. 14A]MBR7196854.1 hypothetical protein [Pseudomonas sp. 14A]
MKNNPVTSSAWHEATDRSNELFQEADRLNAIAYELLAHAADSPGAMEEFKKARAAADAKSLEGKKAWDQARAVFRKKR